jgi:2,3-dihydroxybenzoate decarboxylase
MNCLRIATEEAYAPPEMFARYRKLLESGNIDDPGFESLVGFYLTNNAPRIREVRERLEDVGERRLGDMDRTGIARQILSLTAPGVQVFDGATAVGLAESFNDQLAEAIAKHPDRFSGLAAVAPQDPQAAAKELERGVKKLGLKGAIVNSHTQGEYLDDEKFWDLFAAAEALDVPVYIHPTSLPKSMIDPFVSMGLDGAVYGFAVETGLHLLRIIFAGVFDRFPKLRIVVGHLGEGLPYWLYRIDFMHARMVASARYPRVRPLRRKPGEYVKENLYITSSGMAWQPPISYCQSVMGIDRVMYAMDYPYQFEAAEVKAMDELPLDEAGLKAFYQGNAERVFRL